MTSLKTTKHRQRKRPKLHKVGKKKQLSQSKQSKVNVFGQNCCNIEILADMTNHPELTGPSAPGGLCHVSTCNACTMWSLSLGASAIHQKLRDKLNS